VLTEERQRNDRNRAGRRGRRPGPDRCCPPQDAVIFDMDGVVTDTAGMHAQAWKRLFDEVLTDERAGGGDRAPFDITLDYRRYVEHGADDPRRCGSCDR
jgi:hypothetical protein